MGAEQSTDNNNSIPWEEEALAVVGFHVLKLKPNSPAELAGLTPYFDIILAVNGQTTFQTIQEFAQYIAKYLDQEVTLSVLSLQTRSVRELKLFPRVGWSSNPKDGILGCSVRFSTVERALESVWRILEINPQSPAERAGLQSYSDYVIGCEFRNLESENDLYDLVHDHEGKLLSLLVYNSVWTTCREVVIIPKADWGGEGLLGCGVGYGLLHRIPTQPVQPQEQPSVPNTLNPATTSTTPQAPVSSGIEKSQSGNSSVTVQPTTSTTIPSSLQDVSESLRNPPNEIFTDIASQPANSQTSGVPPEVPADNTTVPTTTSDITTGLAAVSLDTPPADTPKDTSA